MAKSKATANSKGKGRGFFSGKEKAHGYHGGSWTEGADIEDTAMKLNDLLTTVEHSTPEDWHKLTIPTVYDWTETYAVKYEPNVFDKLFIYEQDVDVSIAMAATGCKPFQEKYLEKLPDLSALSVVVALRYRGAIVYDWLSVIVDGGRHLLPMPDRTEAGKFVLPQDKLPMARLLCQLNGVKGVKQQLDFDFDLALKRAGIKIV